MSDAKKNTFTTSMTRKDIQSANVADKIKDYIDKNITTSFSLNKLSETFGISKSYLSHSFKKSFNISVFQYIKNQKLSLAVKYCKSGINFSEAADKAGFEDYRAFYLAYRKQFGVSPSKNFSYDCNTSNI